ncbi:MAG: hypothetical protein DLM57_10500 [Pseudonocardiales bacterium]|nr:MAG: hypothetical protein DLM57_10500 [Pseudonocardiales bacterium]
MSSEPLFTVTQPDETVSVINLATPGEYQDFAFEAIHDDGRRDRFAAYHTGERAIFIDVLTRMAADRPADAVLADVTCMRAEVETISKGLTPTSSQSGFRPGWPTVPRSPAVPFSNSYTIDGRSQRIGLTVAGDKYGLRFSERRGKERGLKVVVPADQLWRFAAGMIWRSYEDRTSLLLSRVSTDEYQDALHRFASSLRPAP